MYQTVLATAFLASTAAAHQLYSRQSAGYPAPLTKGPQPKQEWVDTYNRIKAEGKIPGFAPSTPNGAGGVTYPAGTDQGEDGVCSWTTAHCFGDNDIYDAPDNMYAVAFDDGPVPQSERLYQFLQQNNQSATHFLIGTNIVQYPASFKAMTTLTDMQVLGELGWTAQALFDSSGGIVPKFWRPPYGDADNRVRAIAEEVFGLTLVGWNRDSNDWCLNYGLGNCPSYAPNSQADLEGELNGWINGDKSPGPMGLEHDIGDIPISAFINTYPGLKQQGWDARCVPDLFGLPWYQNAARNGTPVATTLGIGMGNVSVPMSSSAAASSMSASSASSASSSASAPVTTSSSGSSSAPSPSATRSPAEAAADKSGGAVSFSISALASALVGFAAITLLYV
ncbi:hypothetical protein BMF94_3483 [Rhodotorula taiwanensis]|uniref:chitin deacetylase n=1 Tax=Rhodotorula taiwanensis TaxID=741276 RepID=A0A2S5B9T9_9BASI|nr:hypothetical protein BMF94_3483 [Rhodotorula taiwanensis]